MDDHTPNRGVTLRAIVIGAILVVLSNIMTLYSHYLLSSSLFACDYFPLAVGVPFILLLLLLNPVLRGGEKLLGERVRLVLGPGEIITIVIMILVGSTLPTFGLVGYFIGAISAPVHFADEANQWTRTLLPHLPDWIILQDREALRLFYNGMPEGGSIPWMSWAVPVFWWTLFFIAFFLLCFFIVSIMRKQWVEEERLSFPIAEVPTEMVRGLDNPKRAWPDVLRTRLFWLGAALPIFLGLLKIASFFYPGFPVPTLAQYITLPAGFPSIKIQIVFAVIGFAFFGKLEILLSLFLFHILFVIQAGIFNKIGYITGRSFPYSSSYPYSGYQSFGGLIVYVLIGFYLGRRHLKAVFRQALTPSTGAVDDAREFVSCRTALVGAILSGAFLVVWLHKSGMEAHVIAVFLPLVLITFIGITRAVLESGIVWMRGPVIAQAPVLTLIGAPNMQARSIMSLMMTMGWHSDVKSFFMPAAAHSMRMASNLKLTRRRVVFVIALAAVLAYGTSVWYTLLVCYRAGAYNFRIHMFRNGCSWPARTGKKVLSERDNYIAQWRRHDVLAARIGALEAVKRGEPVNRLRGDYEQQAKGALAGRPGVMYERVGRLRGLLDTLGQMSRTSDKGEREKLTGQFMAGAQKVLAWAEKEKLPKAEHKIVDYLGGVNRETFASREGREQVENRVVEALERIRDRERFWKTETLLVMGESRDKMLAQVAADPSSADRVLAADRAELASLTPALPAPRSWSNVFFTLLGAAITIVLFTLRFVFPWWPIHPVGFAFAMVLPVRVAFFSIFLAWLAKTIIMRAGGVKLYNRAKPLFLGLIFGEVLISGIGFFIDLALFNDMGAGHYMYGW